MDIVSVRKATLASFSHPCFSVSSFLFTALKNAKVAIKEATKESIAKKCPSWPGSKCSPKNFMFTYFVQAQILDH